MSPADDELDEPAIPALPKQVGTGVAGKGAVAAGAALVSTMVPGIAIPVAGVTAALQAFGTKLNEHQEARIGETIHAASSTASTSPEDVISRCMDDEDLMLLFAEAVDAARRTRLRSKPKLLGRSLGNILVDDAKIDLEAVWIQILAAVEPPHVKVLSEFVYPEDRHWAPGVWRAGTGTRIYGIANKLGLGDAILPLVQDLHGAGLLTTAKESHRIALNHGGTVETPSGTGREYKATELGAELMNRLEEARGESN